ncbi:hypothetical protein AXF42_Ash012614 [Apostasia shenzhenica]|uniref:PARP catalytic domain-containing protein n=1 Tax=Apostasia shenzhenica TaxID=1088818 RepID=A0A2H9ZT59_9ASPA|nr:hypothetical protein AXF42_Ash012614 [Apostasia shenzhenica]
MATGWFKSLQCKSNALEDVYLPKRTAAKKNPGAPAFFCGSSSQALRDVVFLIPDKLPPFPKKPQPSSSFPSSENPQRSRSQIPQIRHRTKPKPKPNPSTTPSPPPPTAAAAASLPTLADLPDGHSSRRVVEIIFSSSWSPCGAPFPGEIEMLFRVHHPPRAVACFEEYRAAVRSRASDARCAADGNEMMRFHSASAAGGGIYDAGLARCSVGKLAGVRTFAGSGGAHDSAGGGPGRRAMLVCRVIAGRVRPTRPAPYDSESDSVCLGKGELLVFDPRAVLPCFLIIYKV